MKPLLVFIVILLLYTVVQVTAITIQNVGEDFGKSWLLAHATHPNMTQNTINLWNWGKAPKGYTIYNGKPIPPGSGPQWYYPEGIVSSDTPIITNSTALDRMPQDPWVLAQFIGRPVLMINDSAGPLF